MTAVEVITSVERRRRWSRDEKLRIVAESSRPGRTASQVAREILSELARGGRSVGLVSGYRPRCTWGLVCFTHVSDRVLLCNDWARPSLAVKLADTTSVAIAMCYARRRATK
jgi:Transposase